MVPLGPQREHEQHRRLLGQRKELLEKQDRRRVGPVEILEREDERRVVGEPREELADDLEGPPLQSLGGELRRARGGVTLERELEQAAEVRIELVRIPIEELL